MDKFIHLTSSQPGIGKVRFNIASIAYYFRKGTQTMIVMNVPGIVENVAEKVEEIDDIIDRAGGIHFKKPGPLQS